MKRERWGEREERAEGERNEEREERGGGRMKEDILQRRT